VSGNNINTFPNDEINDSYNELIKSISNSHKNDDISNYNNNSKIESNKKVNPLIE